MIDEADIEAHGVADAVLPKPGAESANMEEWQRAQLMWNGLIANNPRFVPAILDRISASWNATRTVGCVDLLVDGQRVRLRHRVRKKRLSG